MRRILKSFVYGTIIGMAACAVISIFFLKEGNNLEPITTPDIASQYEATCRIETRRGGVSTGVLLNTGFVIASGHGVDFNNDLTVQANERNVELEFTTRYTTEKIQGRVIFIGDDYSVIQPARKIRSSIRISTTIPLAGESVYTVGHPLGRDIHLTKGYQSSKTFAGSTTERTSINAYMGNSGGGVFSERGEVVGILKSVGYEMQHPSASIMLAIPVDGKTVFVSGRTRIHFMRIISDWSEYVSLRRIHHELSQKNMQFLIEKQTEAFDWLKYKHGIELFFQLWVLIGFVSIFRKDLFGS